MKSPVPFLSDDEYSRLPLPERWLMQARSQVGVREATGHNDGESIDKYLVAAGKPAGSRLPYCAAGQFWCALNAGAKALRLPKYPAGVAEWRRWATETGRRYSVPQRGRLGYWTVRTDKGEPGHLFMVAGVLPFGVLRCISFNSSEDGSRDGGGVVQHMVTVKGMQKRSFWGFIDVLGLDAPIMARVEGSQR